MFAFSFDYDTFHIVVHVEFVWSRICPYLSGLRHQNLNRMVAPVPVQ